VVGLLVVSALVKWVDRRYTALRRKTEGPHYKSGCLYGCSHLLVWMGLVLLAAWGSFEAAVAVDEHVKRRHLRELPVEVRKLLDTARGQIERFEEQEKALAANLSVLEQLMNEHEAAEREQALERAREHHTRLKLQIAEVRERKREVEDAASTLEIEARFGPEELIDRSDALRKALHRADGVLRRIHREITPNDDPPIPIPEGPSTQPGTGA
jgi:hypothetical protein